MSRPCDCDKPGCRLCFLYHNDDRYRRFWDDGTPIPKQPAGRVRPVQPAGQPVRPAERKPCGGCGAKVKPVSPPARRAEARTLTPGQRVLAVHCDPSGIGDAILGLTAVAGLRAENPDARIVYRVPPASLPWVRLFDAAHDYVHVHAAYRADRTFHFYDSYQQELHEGSRVPRWEYYATYCQTSARLPGHALPAAALAWAEQYRGAVVLAPWSHWASRNWLEVNWRILETKVRAAGLRPLLIDYKNDRSGRFGCEKVLGETPERVAALLSVATCTVGNDSGMVHVAGALGARAIVVCGPSDGAKIFGFYPRVTTLNGKLECSGCYWRGKYHQALCDQVCSSLQTILPDDVMDALITSGSRPAPAASRLLLPQV